MTEHEVFETRLRTALGRYVADGPTDFDALGFARAVATAEPRRRSRLGELRWPRVIVPRLAWLLLATALLVMALVAGALLTGSRPPRQPASWQRIGLLPANEGWPALLNDVVPSENGFLAVGEGGYFTPGYVWASSDGHTWEEVPTGSTFARAALRAVIRTENGYVSGGIDDSGDEDRAAIWWSADGRAWRPVASVADAEGAVVDHLASSNGRFVALGRQLLPGGDGSPARWVSGDAQHWDRVAAGVAGAAIEPIDELVAGSQGFVALSAGGIWTSTDGANWVRATLPRSEPYGVEAAAVVAGADGRIVVAGPNGRVYASDGAAWTVHELAASNVSKTQLDIVGLAETSWGYALLTAAPMSVDDTVPSRSTTLLWTSRDGTTWVRHDLGVSTELACVPCAGLFAAGDGLVAWNRSTIWALPGALAPEVIP
jgi:hypothetical protein